MEKKIFGFSSNKEIKITFLFKYFYHILTVLGATLMAMGGDYAYTLTEAKEICNGKSVCFWPYIFNNWVCLIVGIILGITGLIYNNKDMNFLKEDNERLKKENRKLNKIESDLNSSKEDNESLKSNLREKHSDVVKTWLKMISSEIGLSTHERLTIYFEYKEEFTLLSRFSQNKLYNNIHTQKFPLDQGVISMAWQHNEYKETSSPIYKANNNRYFVYMEKYKYTKERLERITMKSDKLYGIAIQNADDSIGVLLYERISTSDNTENTSDFNQKCDTLKAICIKYQSYLTKYILDAIDLDRSINIDTSREEVEDELVKILGGSRI
ncbi:hypothetical protein A7H1H_0149 [Aliarcobacter butzleri 7h1h]|uniref:hypothetical protein n=1 Tax=Aliarcobacter butzleri TaxID=28197 RepID=UPI00035B9CEE|nr:hypothetical protein [Aliarcobacter butzleri]AGR76484.1 hypothetical protein A7H1H_0149 [Aliarcobacter butzleri 7h1h]